MPLNLENVYNQIYQFQYQYNWNKNPIPNRHFLNFLFFCQNGIDFIYLFAKLLISRLNDALT